MIRPVGHLAQNFSGQNWLVRGSHGGLSSFINPLQLGAKDTGLLHNINCCMEATCLGCNPAQLCNESLWEVQSHKAFSFYHCREGSQLLLVGQDASQQQSHPFLSPQPASGL